MKPINGERDPRCALSKVCLRQAKLYLLFLFACFRYRGHKMKGYKLDCCFSSKDDYVLSCSEDGFVYCWDLVEVSFH